MAFDIVGVKESSQVKTKGNLRIDYKNSNNTNSVYTYNGNTSVRNNNENAAALYTNNDLVHNVFMDIVGSDGILEQKDLNNIDSVAAKYKGQFTLNKKLNEGEVTLTFKNGYNLTIDFYTNQEEKTEDIKNGYEAPYGRKKEYYRQDLIEKLKDSYDIKEETHTNRKGEEYKIYKITAKKDVNLARLKSDLGIRDGIVNANNDGYGHYDDNGHYIDNKRMKNVTIQIPIGELGYELDDRGFFIKLFDAIF